MKTELPKKSKAHEQIIHTMRDAMLKRSGSKIAYIILFGSFARGGWVYDFYIDKDGSGRGYASDYDFLVLTHTHRAGTGYPAMHLESDLRKDLEPLIPVGKDYNPDRHTPHIIVESVQHVNKELRKGQYFFTDIKEEGIVLYDSGEFELQEVEKLSKPEMKEIAQDYFNQWFASGKEFLMVSEITLKKEMLNNSAFQLHQATEHLLDCALLVLADRKPKTHDLRRLLGFCASRLNVFLEIFPKGIVEEEKCFELLCKAYIEARYDKDYVITKEQLDYLIGRVETLRDVVDTVCQERIAVLG